MLLALLLTAALAQPRDLAVEPYLRVEQSLGPIAASAALDLWTTGRALRVNPLAYESNPLARSGDERAALKLAQVGLGVWAVHTVDRRWGRRWGIRVLVGIVALNVGAAVNNHLKAGR